MRIKSHIVLVAFVFQCTLHEDSFVLLVGAGKGARFLIVFIGSELSNFSFACKVGTMPSIWLT